MDNEINLEKNQLKIDLQELLFRFIISCQQAVQKNQLKHSLLSSADIVSAVYYYRKYPNVDEFISAYLNNNKDYFKLQWVRSTWITFSNMTNEELSNLVINQLMLGSNPESNSEEQ